jgi:hypothetical protein
MKKQTLNEQISRIKGMMSLNEQRGDEQSSDSITSPSGNKYYFADNMPKDYKPNNPRIYFNNGGSVSVQASHTHYCEPRNDQGPYSEMEVGFPSEGTIVPDEIMQYLDGNMDAEDFDKHKSVYGYVPISIIKMMVDANDGIKTGELPPMVEVERETNEASDITTNMFFKNIGSREFINKEVADSIRKIIEDSGISTEGISDEDMLWIQNEIKKNPSGDEESEDKGYKLPGYDETMDNLDNLSIRK